MHKDTSVFIKTLLSLLVIIGGATGFNRALASIHTREEDFIAVYNTADYAVGILRERRQTAQELAQLKETLQLKEKALQAQRAVSAVEVNTGMKRVVLQDGPQVRKGKLELLRDAQVTPQTTSVVQPVSPIVVQQTPPDTQSRMKPVVVQKQVRTTRAS